MRISAYHNAFNLVKLFLNIKNKLVQFSEGEYIQAEEGLQRQGYGIHTTCDGLSYYGNWNGDKMNGQGKVSAVTLTLFKMKTFIIYR